MVQNLLRVLGTRHVCACGNDLKVSVQKVLFNNVNNVQPRQAPSYSYKLTMWRVFTIFGHKGVSG